MAGLKKRTEQNVSGEGDMGAVEGALPGGEAGDPEPEGNWEPVTRSARLDPGPRGRRKRRFILWLEEGKGPRCAKNDSSQAL